MDSDPFDVRYQNNFRPVFQNNPTSEMTVSEDIAVNTQLATFTATDQDTGFQSTIKYSLSPDLGYLKIDRTTGVLSVAKQLDRETTNEVIVAIVATDNAPIPFEYSTNHTFKLILTDVNDNAPQFQDSQIHHNVMETETIGTTIIQVTATDPDEGANGQITYSLVSTNDSTGIFSFDANTGQFTLQSKLMDLI